MEIFDLWFLMVVCERCMRVRLLVWRAKRRNSIFIFFTFWSLLIERRASGIASIYTGAILRRNYKIIKTGLLVPPQESLFYLALLLDVSANFMLSLRFFSSAAQFNENHT
jgi:hypothetical protein